MSAVPAALRRASSENVPAGPRNATRVAMGAEGYAGRSAQPARLAERELVGGAVVGGDRLARHRQDCYLEGELDVPLRLRANGQRRRLDAAGGDGSDRRGPVDRLRAAGQGVAHADALLIGAPLIGDVHVNLG